MDRRDFLKFGAGTSLALIVPGLGPLEKVELATPLDVKRYGGGRMDPNDVQVLDRKDGLLMFRCELVMFVDDQAVPVFRHTMDAFKETEWRAHWGEHLKFGDKELCGYRFAPITGRID